MPNWRKLVVSGSDASLNSLYSSTFVSASSFSGDLTGSVYGTSSWAITSSHSITSSYGLNPTISGSLNNVGAIYFRTSSVPPISTAALEWDNGEGTLQLGLAGGNVALSIGEATYQYVYNAQGTTLNKGQVVYGSGSQGGRIAVKLASATAELGSANTIGLVAESILAGAEGWIITNGSLKNVDTSQFTSTPFAYLSSSAGEFTPNYPEAPAHEVRLGIVEKVDAATGAIYVKIDNGYELGELHDVIDTTTTSSYGDILVKSGSVWTNSKQLTGSYVITGSLKANSFTGSLLGTSSYASQALSSSYAVSASNAITASYSVSSSNSVTASYSISSSFVTGSIYSAGNLARSSSFAVTASYSLTASSADGFTLRGAITGTSFVTHSLSGSLVITAYPASTGIGPNAPALVLNSINPTGNSAGPVDIRLGSQRSSFGVASYADNIRLVGAADDPSVFSSDPPFPKGGLVQVYSASNASFPGFVSINSGPSANSAIIFRSSIDGQGSSSNPQLEVVRIWSKNLGLYSNFGFVNITGSLIVTAGVTGSLLGTASLASTASFVTGSIYSAGNLALSSSFAISSSRAVTSSYSVSSSFVTGSIHVAGNLALSSSFAVTSSYSATASYFVTSSVTSASYAATASYVDTALTASYYITSSVTSASYAATASYFVTSSVTSASYALTASYVNNALSASYFITSSVTSASYASTSSYSLDSISSLNNLTSKTQTFAVGTSAGLTNDFNIVSVGSTHTFNIPDADSVTRGVITTGTQTFEGSKRFQAQVVANGGINMPFAGATGSLLGTASYAVNSATASYFVTASVTSASYSVTASYVLSSSYSVTSSYSISASYATTASYFVTSSVTSASYAATASYFITSSVTSASYSISSSNSITSSFVTGSIYTTGNLATSASYAVTASYALNSIGGSGLSTKAGSISAVTFAGNPKTASVVFSTPFPNANYSITVTGEDNRAWSVQGKVSGSFVVNSNSNTALSGNTYWVAIAYGET